MSDAGREGHWQSVYTSKAENSVSWFEAEPAVSLALIALAGTPPDAAVIDIGGGASRLVDRLLERGFADVTVLDLSAAALDAARARLGARAAAVRWLVADATSWEPTRRRRCRSRRRPPASPSARSGPATPPARPRTN